jgi:hypothetical protein
MEASALADAMGRAARIRRSAPATTRELSWRPGERRHVRPGVADVQGVAARQVHVELKLDSPGRALLSRSVTLPLATRADVRARQGSTLGVLWPRLLGRR